jgi:hypothetical protein
MNKLELWILETVILKIGGVNKMIDTIKNALAGRKTYLVALVTIICGIVSWVSGITNTADLIQLIVTAILGCTVRAGVSKVQ